MIKLLKIASILTVILAILTVVLLGAFMVKGKPEISIPKGVVEQFKKPDSNASAGKTPPLVVQASKFALKINPPKPPKPPEDKTPKVDVDVTEKPNPKTTPTRPSKIKLIATCRYENAPDRSLALFDLSAKGRLWFRQGEPLEHLTVYEIKDGSVVLYQSGKFSQELFMPEEKVDSLLKADKDAGTTSRIIPTKPGTTLQPANKTAALSDRRTPPPRVTKKVHVKSVPRRTPEEEKAELDKSISNIKKIMGGEDQTEEDKKAMEALLKLLQEDKGRFKE